MKIDNQLIATSIVNRHPCFSSRASHRFGRIHLPVAPKCNIRCNYCDRRYDCVSESRPGVTSRIIGPREAVDRVGRVVEELPDIRVVGIAGPGDPLYNDETFETFRLVNERFPALHKCMSTNGLLLPEKLDIIKQLGIDTLTVTVNAVEPSIATQVYSFVYYQGKKLTGLEAVGVLLRNQLAGIRLAVEQGIVVKVNTVLIPTINDSHIVEVSRRIKELGAYVQNIIPLIPLSSFRHLDPPSPADVKRIRARCSEIIRQISHCRRCRADAVGLLHRDLSAELFAPCAP
jgi:nitrogen fixation protein NifB